MRVQVMAMRGGVMLMRHGLGWIYVAEGPGYANEARDWVGFMLMMDAVMLMKGGVMVMRAGAEAELW